MPTMGRNNSVREAVGRTMSYRANAVEMGRRAPILVDKSPAAQSGRLSRELPPKLARSFAKTAQALGIKIFER